MIRTLTATLSPRQRVVKYLQQITEHKTVEEQLRQQWLSELEDQEAAERHQQALEQQAQDL